MSVGGGLTVHVFAFEVRRLSNSFMVLFSLQVGDKIGILKKSNGSLHFFINDQDQGEAVTNLPANVYGTVDIYGAAVRVSIVTDSAEEELEIVQANSMYQGLILKR